MFAVQILGSPSLERDGRAVPLPARKLLALLMLLALSPLPLPRGRVAALLWPALDEATGRRNLRRELARLRATGAGDTVRVQADTLALGEAVSCDAIFFARLHDSGQHDAALALWRDTPAEGFMLGDADAFDDWLAQRRAELGERRRQALRTSAAAREAAGDGVGALARIEALLADDPLQEQHHRDAMQLLAAAGRREAALAQYEQCCGLLRSELGLAPMAETDALAASLRAEPGAVEAAAPNVTTGAPMGAPTGRHRPLLPDHLPFVGRGADVVWLEAAWASGGLIVIEGEAGVGKTRLATDFAAAHGPYAMARCRVDDAGLPYASFSRALRALIGPVVALPELPEWVASELARLLPELGVAAPPIRSDEARSRFFEACARAWHSLAAESFDVVILDDWHLADAASRALLGFVAGRRAESAAVGARELLLLRPPADAESAAALRALVGATGARHLRLQALPGEAVLDLVRQLSGASHPVRFAQRLAGATGGNPFFLAETLRHLIGTELLVTDADGGWQTPFDEATFDYRELPVPASVLDTVLARVQRLSAGSRRVLEAAALAAEPFAPRLLAPACALSELDAVLAIEEAVAASLLREHDAGGFAFTHALVQQALSGALSQERRRLVHRRLALGAEAAAAPPSTIAAHHEASGEPARAVPHRIKAGDEAQRLHALPEATRHWQTALDDRPTPAQAILLRGRLIVAAQQQSALDTLLAQASALADLLDSRDLSATERADASIAHCLALVYTGRSEQALAELDALAVAADAPLWAAFLQVRCRALLNLGRFEESMRDAQAVLLLPELPDAERLEMLDLTFVSHHNAGRTEAAVAQVDASLVLARRIGDRHGIARGRSRRGIQLIKLHDLAGAEAELLGAADDCERLGSVQLERVVLYNLSCVYAPQGQHRQALAALRRGLALSPPIQPGPISVMYGVATVSAQFALGDLGAAWRETVLVASAALAQNDTVVRIATATCLLDALGLLGEVALARRLLASVDPQSLQLMSFTASELYVARCQFELALGDVDAAAQTLHDLDSAVPEIVEQRVRMRHAQAHAGVALARGDARAALALLPVDAALGMNGELRMRGMALRVAAEAGLGAVEPATLAAAQALLAGPAEHAVAALELHAALARAEVGADGAALRATFFTSLSDTLHGHPEQQVALRRAWAA